MLDGDRLRSIEASSVRRELEVNALAPLMLAQAQAPRLASDARVALALRPRGIAVVLLHPGVVGTGMTGGQGQISAEESAERAAQPTAP